MAQPRFLMREFGPRLRFYTVPCLYDDAYAHALFERNAGRLPGYDDDASLSAAVIDGMASSLDALPIEGHA